MVHQTMPTTSNGAPALGYLSDQYAATNDPVQRAAFAAAAEELIALNRTPTAVGVLTTIGMLIVSLVMPRGRLPQMACLPGHLSEETMSTTRKRPPPPTTGSGLSREVIHP